MKDKINKGDLGDCYFIAFLNGFMKFQGEKFLQLLGDCFFELGYIKFNFHFYINGKFVKKKFLLMIIFL